MSIRRSALPRLAALALAAITVAGTGCSAPAEGGPVSGTVTFNGKPLPAGGVTFHSRDGRASSGEILDGHYTIALVPLGPCRVTVLTAVGRGDIPEGATSIDPSKPLGSYIPIPDRYHTPHKSDLNYTVTQGPQTYDINLTK